MDDGELGHGQEVDRQLLESRADPAAFLEPSDAALDHVSLLIGLLVEPLDAGLIGFRGDHRPDTPPPQPPQNPPALVALVRCQTPWTRPSADTDGAHHRFKPRGFVALAGRDLHR